MKCVPGGPTRRVPLKAGGEISEEQIRSLAGRLRASGCGADSLAGSGGQKRGRSAKASWSVKFLVVPGRLRAAPCVCPADAVQLHPIAAIPFDEGGWRRRARGCAAMAAVAAAAPAARVLVLMTGPRCWFKQWRPKPWRPPLFALGAASRAAGGRVAAAGVAGASLCLDNNRFRPNSSGRHHQFGRNPETLAFKFAFASQQSAPPPHRNLGPQISRPICGSRAQINSTPSCNWLHLTPIRLSPLHWHSWAKFED